MFFGVLKKKPFPIFKHSQNIHIQHSPEKSGFLAFLEQTDVAALGLYSCRAENQPLQFISDSFYSPEGLRVCLACTSSSQ